MPSFAVLRQKFFNSVNSGVTGPSLTQILNNADKFMLFIFFLKSELQYCNPFWNGSTTVKIGQQITPILQL